MTLPAIICNRAFDSVTSQIIWRKNFARYLAYTRASSRETVDFAILNWPTLML
jgi:hypothetical protein